MTKFTAVAAALLLSAGAAFAQQSTAPVAVTQASPFGELTTAGTLTAAAVVIGGAAIINNAAGDGDSSSATTTAAE